MSYFESIVALYVPYDFNFHEGMTSLESYGLRYITPLVALIVVPITFRIRYNTCSISHACKTYLDALDMFHILNPTCRRTRSIYWHGVWTVVQLVYIMAVKTSASLLLCPTLSRKTLTGTSNVMVYMKL